MKKRKPIAAFLAALFVLTLMAGCRSAQPGIFSKEITVAQLCCQDEALFENPPVSLVYTKSEGEPDSYTVTVSQQEDMEKILNILLSVTVCSDGCHVDACMVNYEDYTFDFGEESYTFCIWPDSYVSYDGLYYEIISARLGEARRILEDYISPDNFEPVSAWYDKDAQLDTRFYDNGDEAPSYAEITLYSAEGTLTAILEGAYDVLSVERTADCYLMSYTLGDFYNHEQVRACRIFVENGELVIESIS